MSLTPLPPAPSTSDPINFSANADAFVAALVQFSAQVNASLLALGTPGLAGITPGGRLTLSSGVPVMVASVVGAGPTTVYYDTYLHQYVPVWNGASTDLLAITADEVSLILDTANHLSTKQYDIFAIKSGGVLKLVTGPAWTNATTRASAISRYQGLWTNSAILAHSFNNAVDYAAIPANTATYLGTIYCSANGKVEMNFFPAAATGGTNNVLGLWNAYNRVVQVASCKDSTGSWSYATTAYRVINGYNTNRISVVQGLIGAAISARYEVLVDDANVSTSATIGISFDNTIVPDVRMAQMNIDIAGTGVQTTMACMADIFGTTGLTVITPLEKGSSNCRFNSGGSFGGLTVRLET